MKTPTKTEMELVNIEIDRSMAAFHEAARKLPREMYRKAWEQHLYKTYARHGVLAFFKWRKEAEQQGKIVVF